MSSNDQQPDDTSSSRRREPMLIVNVQLPRCPHCESTEIVRTAGGILHRYMRCKACGQSHIQRRERRPEK